MTYLGLALKSSSIYEFSLVLYAQLAQALKSGSIYEFIRVLYT